jgi:23S rRNA (pseudouridine1915-N3)-methyltransferase
MQLTVAAVGQRMPAWVQEAWRDYARRLPRELTLELREIPLGRRGRNAPVDKLRAAEGTALLAAVPQGHRVIALDERGRQWSTRDVAGRLQDWMREEHGVGFLIGGPDGLSEDCLKLAQDTWALGRLTLPHPLVRVILAEQLYRAWSITRNHPYHRA